MLGGTGETSLWSTRDIIGEISKVSFTCESKKRSMWRYEGGQGLGGNVVDANVEGQHVHVPSSAGNGAGEEHPLTRVATLSNYSLWPSVVTRLLVQGQPQRRKLHKAGGRYIPPSMVSSHNSQDQLGGHILQ